MPMEERDAQQEKDSNGQKKCSPKHNTFQTKLLSLTEQAKLIRNEPLRTVAHLVDKEWLQESL